MTDLLTNFVFELLVGDELQMARLLRKKLLNKREEHIKKQTTSSSSSPSLTQSLLKTTTLANTIAHTLIRFVLV